MDSIFRLVIFLQLVQTNQQFPSIERRRPLHSSFASKTLVALGSGDMRGAKMTSLRTFAVGGAAAALFMTGAASKSFAVEPGDFTNYLRGATQGLLLGGLPPEGLYANFSPNATGLGGNAGVGNQTIPGKVTAPAFGEGVALLWVPGWHFLGATYSFAVVQGAYIGTSESSINPPFATSSVSSQLANTSFTPINLSWNLGKGWSFGAAVNVIGPDGSQWGSTFSSVDLNPDYWTVAPGAAISYFTKDWSLSANLRYDINTGSRGVTMGAPFLGAAANGYTSGNEVFGDFTALYKVGKWQFGPVGYFEAQTTADRPGGGFSCTSATVLAGGGCGN